MITSEEQQQRPKPKKQRSGSSLLAQEAMGASGSPLAASQGRTMMSSQQPQQRRSSLPSSPVSTRGQQQHQDETEIFSRPKGGVKTGRSGGGTANHQRRGSEGGTTKDLSADDGEVTERLRRMRRSLSQWGQTFCGPGAPGLKGGGPPGGGPMEAMAEEIRSSPEPERHDRQRRSSTNPEAEAEQSLKELNRLLSGQQPESGEATGATGVARRPPSAPHPPSEPRERRRRASEPDALAHAREALESQAGQEEDFASLETTLRRQRAETKKLLSQFQRAATIEAFGAPAEPLGESHQTAATGGSQPLPKQQRPNPPQTGQEDQEPGTSNRGGSLRDGRRVPTPLKVNTTPVEAFSPSDSCRDDDAADAEGVSPTAYLLKQKRLTSSLLRGLEDALTGAPVGLG